MQRVVAALVALTGCGFQIAGGSSPDAGKDPGTDAGDDAPVDTSAVDRVTDGLVALYTFEETSGAMVMDRSGVNPSVDLVIANQASVERANGRLTITAAASIASAGAATKIAEACRDADAVTLEAWVLPRTVDGTLISRIVTLSSSESSLAVSLMAFGSHFEFRLDGPLTDANGLPALNTANDTLVVDTLRHVVLVTAPTGERRIYLDGVQVAADMLGGDLAVWGATGHRFAVGNEVNGNRPFFGTFDLVAVYARALSPADVEQNFAAGPR